jgi:hypothetical protein
MKNYRNIKREYLKEKLMSLKQAIRRKISDLHRDINEVKNSYQCRTNLFSKDENGDLHTGSHNILNRWKN